MRSAMFYATLILVLAIAPVFFIEGLAGAFFQPLALSYVLALLASMLVALTLTPALCLLLLANAPVERHASPLVGWLQRGYERGLARIIAAAPFDARRRRRAHGCRPGGCAIPQPVAAAFVQGAQPARFT